MNHRVFSVAGMRLPPPDPHEDFEPRLVGAIPAPMVLFRLGAPSAEADRRVERFLDLRPGLLAVLSHG